MSESIVSYERFDNESENSPERCNCYQMITEKHGRHLVGIIPDEQCKDGQIYLTGLSVKQKKDGKTRPPLSFNYCPFCGQKYKRLYKEDFA